MAKITKYPYITKSEVIQSKELIRNLHIKCKLITFDYERKFSQMGKHFGFC